jgi:hypothetical protein
MDKKGSDTIYAILAFMVSGQGISPGTDRERLVEDSIPRELPSRTDHTGRPHPTSSPRRASRSPLRSLWPSATRKNRADSYINPIDAVICVNDMTSGEMADDGPPALYWPGRELAQKSAIWSAQVR